MTATIPPLTSLTDLLYESTQPVSWLIEDTYPQGEVVLMAGASHSGKTYLALDQGLAVAYGRPWAGKATTQAPVIYAPSEGRRGIGRRVRAAADHHTPYEAVSEDFHLFSETLHLAAGDSLDHLKSHAHRITAGLIIVDVLRDATAGIEENSAQFGDAFGLLRDLGQQTGATVLVLHHLGKDASKGSRGHSSLKDKTDLEVIVTASETDLGVGRTTVVALDNSKNRNHDSWSLQMELRKPSEEAIAPVIMGVWLENQGGHSQPAPAATLNAVAVACNHLHPLATGQGCKLSAAAKEAGMSRQAFTKQAESARESGHLEKVADTYPALWRLTAKGEAATRNQDATNTQDTTTDARNRQHPMGAGVVASGRPTTMEQLAEEWQQAEDRSPQIDSPPISDQAAATVLSLIEGGKA